MWTSVQTSQILVVWKHLVYLKGLKRKVILLLWKSYKQSAALWQGEQPVVACCTRVNATLGSVSNTQPLIHIAMRASGGQDCCVDLWEESFSSLSHWARHTATRLAGFMMSWTLGRKGRGRSYCWLIIGPYYRDVLEENPRERHISMCGEWLIKG